MRQLVFIACASLLMVSCADKGSAPTVGSVSCTPMTLTVAQQTSVTCSVMFEDADGDLDSVHIQFVDPAAMSVTSDAAVAGVAGVRAGTATVTLLLQPTMVGAAQLHVNVVDVQGNASNVVTSAFDCVTP
ncbi:MAG: hypothetical protein IPK60_17360 [Sandaracinaceae bacterium]|jgi:hypothetical protein|nr:hypothetical protein [Sandaracinaceae bacterium]